MSDILVDLIPTNLIEEKEKFFADPTRNPQLTYNRDFSTQELTKWGTPDMILTAHSKAMLDQDFPSTSREPNVTQQYIEDEIQFFNQKYPIEKKIVTHFSEEQVTRCRIHENHIYFQLPIGYTHSKLADLFRHELETHLLRFENTKKQTWDQNSIDGISFRKTEEGLANLHTHLTRKDKIFRRSYLTYLAVAISQKGSFVDVFNMMISYKVSKPTAWNIALRTKRGILDTSQPGGLTKDISYLEGSVRVWDWMMNPENNPKDLYVGRVGLVDLPRLLTSADTTDLIIPHFMDNLKEYMNNIKEIGRVNKFDQLHSFYES